jgi:molecular chaperone GrpE
MINLLKDSEQDIRGLMLKVETISSELQNTISENEKHNKKLLLGILEVLDSLESKLYSVDVVQESLSEETMVWVNKFRMPYKKLLRLLSEENVVPIEVSIGEAVNPVWHQAVETIVKAGSAENSISEVHQKGYLIKGKLLRNSTVTIVKNSNKQ